MKWNESGFRPPLCTYRLNWARRNSWGWWDDWDDTVLQTQDSKFEPWRSEAEHANSRSRRPPQYWLSHVDGEETFFVSFKPPRPGTEPGTLAWKAAVLTTTLGPPPHSFIVKAYQAGTRRWINVVLALAQRRRRWTNAKTTLIQRLVSAWNTMLAYEKLYFLFVKCSTYLPKKLYWFRTCSDFVG